MNQNSKMLAISNEAVYVPLVLRNPLSSLVTALPYIDEENDNNMNLKINGLIEDEMKKLDKHKNYLESLPEPKFNYINSQEFNSEIDRIKNDKEIIANLMKRYQFDDIVPLDKTNDPLIWKKLSDHLATLYQYNNMKFKHYFLYFRAYNKHFLNRLFNVELMMKYGPENWKKYVENSDNMVKNVEKINEKLRFDVNELNAQRKFEQYEVGEKLNLMKNKIGSLNSKNELLEEECTKLENEIFNMRRKKMKLR